MNGKIKLVLLIVFTLLITTLKLHAQSEGECGTFADPDGGCPLDTWVIYMVPPALAFVIYHLSRKHRSEA